METTEDHLDVSFLPVPEQITGEPHGAFTRVRRTVPRTSHEPLPEPVVPPVRAEAKSPPTRVGGTQRRASAPLDQDFEHAAVFHVAVPAHALHGDDEVLLVLGYTGDVARAYVGGRLVADHFWYGPEWEIGLRRFADQVVEHGVEVRILPRPPESAVYVDQSVRARYTAALDTAPVDSVRLVRRARVELW